MRHIKKLSFYIERLFSCGIFYALFDRLLHDAAFHEHQLFALKFRP